MGNRGVKLQAHVPLPCPLAATLVVSTQTCPALVRLLSCSLVGEVPQTQSAVVRVACAADCKAVRLVWSQRNEVFIRLAAKQGKEALMLQKRGYMTAVTKLARGEGAA